LWRGRKIGKACFSFGSLAMKLMHWKYSSWMEPTNPDIVLTRNLGAHHSHKLSSLCSVPRTYTIHIYSHKQSICQVRSLLAVYSHFYFLWINEWMWKHYWLLISMV
jgi:hypothetical protein